VSIIKKQDSFIVTPTSMSFAPNITWAEWSRKGHEFSQFINIWDRNLRWWLGDWIIFGENHFPDKYSQALTKFMYSKQSLRNIVYVCRNVPPENRMEDEDVSFEHHYVVAKIPRDQQRAWLEKAKAELWTSFQFQNAVKGRPISKRLVPSMIRPTPKDVNFDVWWENTGSKIHPELEAIKCREVAEAAWDASGGPLSSD
jgi:hypothetical protein